MTARTENMMATLKATVLMVAVLGMPMAAQGADQTAATKQAPATQQPAPATATKRVIVVSLEDRKLALVENGKVVKVYTVAVGKPSTPSPVGTFSIARRVMNPTYSHDGRTVPPGPNNPVGTRWMGLSIPGYGIHGTNVPSSIGKAASHGCIRMAKKDLEELYPMVEVGDTVELIGQRNQETAQLFGDAPTPLPNAQPATQTVVAAAQLPIAARQLAITAPAATQQMQKPATQPAVFTMATLSSLMFAGSL